MHPDLARLIELQHLETSAEEARRRIADEPLRAQALDARLDAARKTMAGLRQQLTDVQAARRAIEKDLAVIQGRLTKFRDQLMEVKTNREYQAMQREIEVAQHEVRVLEDRILERMLESDEVAAQVKQAETALGADEKTVAEEHTILRRETETLRQELDRAATVREGLVRSLDPQALAVYEHVARGRKGIAVAAAKDGHCSVCHVRLRPQVFNDVRKNDRIIQCDSCMRILYYPGQTAAAPGELAQAQLE
jgi:predicted  nucleic acid-binding Zn-ribbon protein